VPAIVLLEISSQVLQLGWQHIEWKNALAFYRAVDRTALGCLIVFGPLIAYHRWKGPLPPSVCRLCDQRYETIVCPRCLLYPGRGKRH
jgi:hypothetical protein